MKYLLIIFVICEFSNTAVSGAPASILEISGDILESKISINVESGSENCNDDIDGENVDDCGSSPCQNEGLCFDGIDSYTCQCTDGFTGVDCEINIDDCELSSCQNGVCIDGVNSYTCDCIAGFNGANCEYNVDDCGSSPCQNEGLCIDGIDSYRCLCTDGFTGLDCEISPTTTSATTTTNNGSDYDDCELSPCLNGGICIDGPDSYTCECGEGFAGDICEIGA